MVPTTFERWEHFLTVLWNYVPIYQNLLSGGLDEIPQPMISFVNKVREDLEFAKRMMFPDILEPEAFSAYEAEITEYFASNSEGFAGSGKEAVRTLASVAHFVEDFQKLGMQTEFIQKSEYPTIKSDLDTRLAHLHSARLTRLTTGALAIIARSSDPGTSTEAFSSSCAITPLLRTKTSLREMERGTIYLLHTPHRPLVYLDTGHQCQIEFFDDDLEGKELEKLLETAEELANKEGKQFSPVLEARWGYLIQTLTSGGYLPLPKMPLEEALKQVDSLKSPKKSDS